MWEEGEKGEKRQRGEKEKARERWGACQTPGTRWRQ